MEGREDKEIIIFVFVIALIVIVCGMVLHDFKLFSMATLCLLLFSACLVRIRLYDILNSLWGITPVINP
jgi:hypothetical protein